MRTAVMTALATIALHACGQNAPANETALGNAPTNTAETPAAPLAPAAAPATREAALQIMHERHEGMEQIGKSTKTIKRALDSSSPDEAEIQKAAATIADLSVKSANWFPQGTGPDVGKTGAKPEIWQTHDDFLAKDRDFAAAAKAFNAAAASGSVDAIRSSFGDLGKTCKACHEKYRSDMHR
jgi:cytochrome c556